MGWVDGARLADLATVAEMLGLNGRGRALAPCPSCGLDRRGSADPRGPVSTFGNGLWKCQRCQAGGDAIDLVSHQLHGRPLREARADELRDVREWFTRNGLISDAGGPEGPQASMGGNQRPFGPQAGREAPARPLPPPVYPPAGEVSALWDAACDVRRIESASAWLRGRGLDPATVAEMDLARALPDGAPCPPWAHFGRFSWVGAGYRVLVPLYDARGALVTLRARLVTPPVEGVKPPPKALPPAGRDVRFEVRGAVMASGAARAVLVTGGRPKGWPAGLPVRLVVTEGEPDFLTWSTSAACVGGEWGAFGLFSGSWTPDLAARIPDGSRIVVRTHNDTAGHKYAETVKNTLQARCTVLRAV